MLPERPAQNTRGWTMSLTGDNQAVPPVGVLALKDRVSFIVMNRTGTNIFIKYGDTCTSTEYSVLIATDTAYVDPFGYTGPLSLSKSAGLVRLTELYYTEAERR